MDPAARCAKQISSSACWRQMNDFGVFFFFSTVVSLFCSSCCSRYSGSMRSVHGHGWRGMRAELGISQHKSNIYLTFYPSALGRSPATCCHKSFQSVCFGPALELVTVKASGFPFKQIFVVRCWWGMCGETQDRDPAWRGWKEQSVVPHNPEYLRSGGRARRW